jgi:hypothetical protein
MDGWLLWLEVHGGLTPSLLVIDSAAGESYMADTLIVISH